MTRNRVQILLASMAFGAATVMGPVAVAHAGPTASPEGVCAYLDNHPGVGGVESLLVTAFNEGATPEEAMQKVAIAVAFQCTEHMGALQAFAVKWSPVKKRLS